MSDLKVSHIDPDLERGQNVTDAGVFKSYRNQQITYKMSDLQVISHFDPDLQRGQNVTDAGLRAPLKMSDLRVISHLDPDL